MTSWQLGLLIALRVSLTPCHLQIHWEETVMTVLGHLISKQWRRNSKDDTNQFWDEVDGGKLVPH